MGTRVGMAAVVWAALGAATAPGGVTTTAAGRAPASRPTGTVTQTDVARAVVSMRRELGPGFRVEAQSPFVVAGDLPRAQFRRVKVGTIGGCSRALWKQFFTQRPTTVLKVYLFDGKQSYEAHTQRLFGRIPDTPFGYYSSQRKALVMNIATGGGTLVHEMVHALAEPDWPTIPAWFNEGLGSLFEQCRFDGPDRLVGLPNWRLKGLKRAIRRKRLVDLVRVMGTTDDAFYDDTGLYYAEARYWCMYLQHLGVLEAFYRQYRDRFAEDRTGVRFVRELTRQPMPELQRRWIAWVGTLHYRK